MTAETKTMTDGEFYKFWMTKYLGSVNVKQQEDGSYEDSLADVFQSTSHAIIPFNKDSDASQDQEIDADSDDLLNMLNRVINNALMEDEDEIPLQQVRRIAATGNTEEESLEALFNQAIDISLKETQSEKYGVLFKLRLKKGQDKSQLDRVLENNVLCRTIKHNDPEHSHSSHKLIDFEFIEVNPIELRAEGLGFKEFHTHILAVD